MLRTVGQWMTQDPPHGRRIPGPVPGSDARSRDGRPEEAGRRDDRHQAKSYARTSIRSATIQQGHREHDRRQAGGAPPQPADADATPPTTGRAGRADAGRAVATPAAAAEPAAAARRRRAASKPPRRAVPDAGRQSARMSREDEEKEIEATKAPLMEHLIELRSRLIKALIAFVIAFVVCFFFAKQIYNVLIWPLRLGGRRRRTPSSSTPALLEYFITQLKLAMFGAAFISFPVIADADLHVRRARPLPQRAPGLPAVSGRDADLLPARRGGGLFPGLADAGALLARHAAVAAATGRPTIELLPKVERIPVADDEADPRLRRRLPASGDPDAARPRRHPHLATSSRRSGATSSSAPSSSPRC